MKSRLLAWIGVMGLAAGNARAEHLPIPVQGPVPQVASAPTMPTSDVVMDNTPAPFKEIFSTVQNGDACQCQCVPQCSWTGFYAGVSVGAGINNSGYTLSPSGTFAAAANPFRTDSGTFSQAAVIAGGQIGYNYQVKSWVFGIETDLYWTNLRELDAVSRPLGAPLAGTFNHNVSQDIDWFGTVRGRVGYAAGDFLLYGTGGLAYGGVSSSSNVAFTTGGDRYAGSRSSTEVGWTVGAGVEYKLNNRWSVKAEYQYVDLGSSSYTSSNVPPPAFPTQSYSTDVQTQFHVVTVGLNYRFGWGRY